MSLRIVKLLRADAKMCLTNVAAHVRQPWQIKYAEARLSAFLGKRLKRAEIKYLPPSPCYIPFPAFTGWQEYRLLRLMTWNSWNPAFRQCAHFKRGSANSDLFLERRHAHTVCCTCRIVRAPKSHREKTCKSSVKW